MAPTLPLVAALFRLANADLQEDMGLLQMQMPVKETSMDTDAGDSDAKGAADSECACPGYFEEDCRAHAEQGCTWTDAGDSNAPWCQCDEEQWNAWREEQRQQSPPQQQPPQQNCDEVTRAEGEWIDHGYVDAYRGWYDVSGCGSCNDYCRWVGNSGSGGDPASQLSHDESWWSCRLAGTDEIYSPRDHFSSFPHQRCESHLERLAGGSCEIVVRAEAEWIDEGYADAYRGWYDVSGCGACHDYCRWVGNSGSGGDPASQLSHGESWWSCRLAGTNEIYSPRGYLSSFSHQKCDQCFGNYEAEDAAISGAREHTPPTTAPHQGFSGRSFVDYINANDDYIEWTLDSCISGSVTLSFRYALASGDRPLKVIVNGVEITSSLSTPATGAWSNYDTVDLPATFEAGTNTVRLVANGSSGANVDSLIVG